MTRGRSSLRTSGRIGLAMAALLPALLLGLLSACREEQRAIQPVVTSAPEHTPPSAEATPTASPPTASPAAETQPAPPDVPPASPTPEPARREKLWLQIEGRIEAMQRAWAEGTLAASDRIVISTGNVSQFRLELSQLDLNWQTRIVLQIDGVNSEVTRKRWPALSLRRTATGAWETVD